MAGKISKWESELWSYICSGDGEHCPLHDHCQTRQSGRLCVDDCKEKLSQLLESGNQFNADAYDFIEPLKYEEMGVVFQLVEKLAQKKLKRGGVCCPPVPTELIALANGQHPIEIHTLPLKAYHGAIWRLKDKWVIQLQHGGTSATDRFTLFHETFHILAHCGTTPVFRKRGVRRGSFNELLADYFAICVLLPKEWVKEKWAEVKDVGMMAKIFGVPKLAIRLRLRQLGLI